MSNEQSSLAGSVSHDKGIVVVTSPAVGASTLESENPGFEGYFDVFDTEMNWLTTIPADDLREDRMAVRMAVARDGALWINWHGDYPTVTRYELSFK